MKGCQCGHHSRPSGDAVRSDLRGRLLWLRLCLSVFGSVIGCVCLFRGVICFICLCLRVLSDFCLFKGVFGCVCLCSGISSAVFFSAFAKVPVELLD